MRQPLPWLPPIAAVAGGGWDPLTRHVVCITSREFGRVVQVHANRASGVVEGLWQNPLLAKCLCCGLSVLAAGTFCGAAVAGVCDGVCREAEVD